MRQPNWIGQTIGGRYRLETLLGQGGMSAVYKGNDPNLKRDVAIKLIHSHLSSNPEFVRRFEREAEAVARLRHPNIIQVYDFAHDGNVYYMVLEYLPGLTLQQRLEDLAHTGQHLPLPDAVRILSKVCEAVAYAHERGMVHRDLKPANVMLNPQGEPILMDFGVARMLGAAWHTATGTLIGTAYYMAPEQIRGKHPDGRADIYSLGVMLFEILAGRRPFEAESASAVMMMHLNNPVPDLRRLNADVPPSLATVVNCALAKDPEQRFQSATDMARALRAADLRPAPPAVEGTALDLPAQGAVQDTPPPPTPPTAAPRPAQPSPSAEPMPGLASPAPSAARARPGSRLPLALAGGFVAVLLVACVVAAGILTYNAVTRGGGTAPTRGPSATFNPVVASALTAAFSTTQQAASTLEVLLGGVLTQQPSGLEALQTQVPGLPPTATVPPPTDTLAPPTDTPTPTEPAGPYVWINDIHVEGNRYIVDYETFGYQEVLPGIHVHFFFDTVPPELAGVGQPNAGPWFVWGGPRPFNGYTTADRPAAATQMCALVANPNHSVIPDTGNCFDLPG